MKNFYQLYTLRMTLAAACLLHSMVSYSQTYPDVAPIFFNRCTSCHHEGGAGPFPFMTYSQTIQEATDIFTVLDEGTMPPWSPDTTYTRFMHERIITASEKAAIMTWIMNGVPPGDTLLAPTPPVYTSYQLFGTPTMELQIPTFVSNAVNEDSYVCFSLPSNLAQDRVLRAFEIVPGNPEIVHHVLVNADTTGLVVSDLSGTCYNMPGQIGIGGFAPGAPPTVFPGQAPMKLGIPIKAGSNIILQLHYPEGSAGMVDSTRIRLYFYPVNEPGIRPVYAATLLQNWNLIIPPDSISTFSAQLPPLPVPISVLATFPHSHLLCTDIVNYAYAGTDTIPLIRINDWDFEWQGYYNYRFPVMLPANYIMNATHLYDNTSANPNNPFNPPQLVTAGFSTTDEMLFDGYQFTNYLPGDELVDLEALLANDTLLTAVTHIPGRDDKIFSAAAPNPSRGEVIIRADTNDPRSDVYVYSIRGGTPILLPRGRLNGESYITRWDGNLENGHRAKPGVYSYQVISVKGKATGRIILLPH